MSSCDFRWRGVFNSDELNRLHAEAFGHAVESTDWLGQITRHSLGWVTARDGRELVGFVNVPWDGGVHAFVLDAMVVARLRRTGIGTALIEVASREAGAAGCRYLHVDFAERHRSFYLESCGFSATLAGLLPLASRGENAGG